MLKQTITYTDFNDESCTEVLHFNLTKTELADNLYLQDDLLAMQKNFAGLKREFTTAEIRQVIDLVKTFMRLSYGIRSEDGKRFVKTPELWTEFTQTAAYDSFLFSLFDKPEKAMEFMIGIFPKDLRDEAMKSSELNELLGKMKTQEEEKKAAFQVHEPTPEQIMNAKLILGQSNLE